MIPGLVSIDRCIDNRIWGCFSIMEFNPHGNPYNSGLVIDDHGDINNQAHAQGAAALKKMSGVKVIEEEKVPETDAVENAARRGAMVTGYHVNQSPLAASTKPSPACCWSISRWRFSTIWSKARCATPPASTSHRRARSAPPT